MFQGMDLPTIIARGIVLLIAFPIHEFAHAWVADYFGDTTPRMHGRLTLNPLAHLDVFGSLLLLVAGFGWAKPVPVNPTVLRQKSPAALMWVSLAGPLSNFLMAVFAVIPFRLHWVDIQGVSGTINGVLPSPANFLFEFVVINLILMVFNLIPLSPLDGEKVLVYLLPGEWEGVFDRIRPYGSMILLLMFISEPVLHVDLFNALLETPMTFLLRLLIKGLV